MKLKKLISSSLVASIVLLLVGSGALAQGTGGTYTLNSSSSIINAGSQGLIVLNVKSNQPINVVQTTISYPANKLTLTKLDTSGTPFEIKAKETSTPGSISITRGTLTPVSGENKVAAIAFTAKENTAVSEITLSNPSLIVESTTNKNIFTGTTYHTVQGNTNTTQVTEVDVPDQYLPPTATPVPPKNPQQAVAQKSKNFFQFVIKFFSNIFNKNR